MRRLASERADYSRIPARLIPIVELGGLACPDKLMTDNLCHNCEKRPAVTTVTFVMTAKLVNNEPPIQLCGHCYLILTRTAYVEL